MVGTHIGCCISNCAQAEFIPNVNKSADAQPDYRVMTKNIKLGAGGTKKCKSFGKNYEGLALAAMRSAQKNSRLSEVELLGRIMKISAP